LTPLFWIPWGYFSLWFIAFFVLIFISLSQVLAIHTPKPKKAVTSRVERKNSARITSRFSAKGMTRTENEMERSHREIEEQKESKLHGTLETPQSENSNSKEINVEKSDEIEERTERSEQKEETQPKSVESSVSNSSSPTSASPTQGNIDIAEQNEMRTEP
jgi:DNA mismatch repair ATPase MutL